MSAVTPSGNEDGVDREPKPRPGAGERETIPADDGETEVPKT